MTVALTRQGAVPNIAARPAITDALRGHLELGEQFCAPDADIDLAGLRAWAARTQQLARDLADTIEAPLRNRILEMLESSSNYDDVSALTVLRINIAGDSSRGLGRRCDVLSRTIDRVEAGGGCRVGAAHALAEFFGLLTTELFSSGPGESLRCKSVAELREALEPALS